MENTLLIIIKDLQKYKKDRDTSLFESISRRLNTSLSIYMEELNKDTEYLENRNELKLVKKLNK